MKNLPLVQSTFAYQNLSKSLQNAVSSPSIYPCFHDAILWIKEGMTFTEWEKITGAGIAVISIVEELFELWDGVDFAEPVLYEDDTPTKLKLIPISEIEIQERDMDLDKIKALKTSDFYIIDGEIHPNFITKRYVDLTDDEKLKLEKIKAKINKREGKPTMNGAFNFNPLQELCTNYLNAFDNGSIEPDEDMPHHIFHAAMELFFGENVSDYINSRTL